jgi:hypothetical protein
MTHTTVAKSLGYIDCDGIPRAVMGCALTQDKADRFWLWSDALQHNIAYKAKTKEDCLLAAISSLLFSIKMRDDRIAELQKIADLARNFAEAINPSANDEQ